MSTRQDELGKTPSQTSDSEQEDTQDSSSQESEEITAAAETPEEFTDPLLRGKSPKEIEEIFRVQRNQVHEYGRQLSEVSTRVRDIDERTKPAPPTMSASDFFEDPVAVSRQMMAEQIEPLREELRGAIRMVRGAGVDDRMKAKHPDWDAVRPYVDTLLDNGGFPDREDENTLDMLYYTAKGIMSERGISLSGETREAPKSEPRDAPPRGQGPPPQHRSSSPPPPPREREGTRVRALTENEKVLAKHYGMSPDEYLEWMDKQEDEESGIDFVTGRSEQDLIGG